MKKFKELVHTISEEHKIDPNIIKAFFSLDKKTYPRIAKYTKLKNICLNISVIIEGFEDKPLNYKTIRKAYIDKNSEFIDLIEDNASLFPKTTEQYIKNQMKKGAVDSKIFKISNSFQKSAFDNIFLKTPTIKTADKYFRTFCNLKNPYELFNSLYFLFDSVINNVEATQKNSQEYSIFKSDLSIKASKTLEKCVSTSLNSYEDDKLKHLFKNISSEEFIELILKHGYCLLKSKYPLYALTKSQSNKTRIEEFISVDFNKGVNQKGF